MTAPTLKYKTLSTSQLNKLYLLNSLSKTDYNTSKIIHQHLNVIHRIEKSAIHIEQITSKSQLLKRLSDIEKQCISGARPIIQFDMHGSTEGIKIEQTKETIHWKDLLPYLTKIHLASEGNLTVVFAACEAASIIDSIRVTNPSPFFGMLAPKHIILESDLGRDLLKFYGKLFEENRLIAAHDLPEDQYHVYREDDFALENIMIPFLQSQCQSNPEIKKKLLAKNKKTEEKNILKHTSLREQALTAILNNHPNIEITQMRNNIKTLLEYLPEIVIACIANFVGNHDVKRELTRSLTELFEELFRKPF